MLWSPNDREWWLERGAAARRRHAAWLSAAIKSPRPLPRIPTRPISQGGFDPVLARPGGREWAAQWWTDTLESPELDLPEEH
jgi:hypothetical protein